MDIYFGSDKCIPDGLNKRFLSYRSLGDYQIAGLSESHTILHHKGGETLVLSNDQIEIIFDGYIPGVTGSALSAKVIKLAEFIVDNKVFSYNEFCGVFNICIKEKLTGNIRLSADPSALLPLYYCNFDSAFFYCSHGFIMASVLNSTPDYSGICQKMQFGYTLGSRTYFENIKRTNPGETIKYESVSGKIYSSYKNVYYTERYSSIKQEDEIITNLESSFCRLRETYSKVGLMLSEGFDSRFVGAVAHKTGFLIESFTHGTNGTLGQKIAGRVAESLNSKHYFCDLTDGFPLDSSRLSNQLLLSDNLNIPYWIFGSEYFRNKNEGFPVIIGTALDTTLGGHAFYKPSRPVAGAVKQRYSEIIKQDLGLISSSHIENTAEHILKSFYISDPQRMGKLVNMTFNPIVASDILNAGRAINKQLEEEYTRLQATGSELPSQILQRFFLENRVRKYSFGQELTIRAFNKIYIPSYEYGFMSLASTIDPIIRLHHKLYLIILRKYTPSLLKISNGAYGMSSIYPRLILETSRFIQKKIEKGKFRDLLKNRGALSSSNFRSAFVTDYCVRDENKIHEFEVVVEKNNKIFNSAAMHEYFQEVKDYNVRTFTHERFYRGLEVCQILQGQI